MGIFLFKFSDFTYTRYFSIVKFLPLLIEVDCYKGQAVKKLNLHYITIKKPPFIYWYFWSHHSVEIDFQDTHPIIRKFPFKRACPFIRTNLIPINSSYLVPSLKLDHYSSPEVENEGEKYHG